MSKKIKPSVALLDQKKKILASIEYYEKKIEEAREDAKKPTSYFGNYDQDSDSDTDRIYLADNGPSISELKQQEKMLRTCLAATRELSKLEVLQYEVKNLVKDPPLKGASPVQGEGMWREVVADCCLDLVPFVITFYAFKANRSFAPTEYRGLKVSVLKKTHEMELSKSILQKVKRPGHAIEVIRSYSLATRTRRTTIERLTKRFGDLLHCENIPEGGYRLKCANLMDMSWTLQNEWSPVAPFHHRTIFNFEFMDEAYVKIIKQLHRRLSEPAVDIEQRTHHMVKIISACLEAQGLTQELHGNASSHPEIARKSKKRRKTSDREAEASSEQRDHTGSAVVAPPTGQPKIPKRGSKNAYKNNNTTKRPMEKEHNENFFNSKKAKTKANNHEVSTENVATSKNNKRSKKTSAVGTSESIKKKSDEKVKIEKIFTNKVAVSTSESIKKSDENFENEKITTKKVSVSTSGAIKKKSDENVKNEKITTKKVAVSTSGGIKKKSGENIKNEEITPNEVAVSISGAIKKKSGENIKNEKKTPNTVAVSTTESIKKKSDENIKKEKMTPNTVAVSISGAIKKKSGENIKNEKITPNTVAVSTTESIKKKSDENIKKKKMTPNTVAVSISGAIKKKSGENIKNEKITPNTVAVSTTESIKKKSDENIKKEKMTPNTVAVSTSESIKKKSDENIKNEKITPNKVAVCTSESIKKKSNENVENEKITTKKEDKKRVTELQNTGKLSSANKIQKYAQNTAIPVSEIAKTHGNLRSNEKIVENKGTSKLVKTVVPTKLRYGNIAKNNVEGKTNNKDAPAPVNDASENKVAHDKNATIKNDVAGTTVGKTTRKIIPTKKIIKRLASGKNVQKVETVSSEPNTNTKVIEKVKVAKIIPGKTIDVNANAKNPNYSIHTKIPVALHKPKATISTKNDITGITKALKRGNPGKENAQNNTKVSKINFKFSQEKH